MISKSKRGNVCERCGTRRKDALVPMGPDDEESVCYACLRRNEPVRFYELSDPLTEKDRKNLGLHSTAVLQASGRIHGTGLFVRAIKTAERRPPKKGEWYCSGNPATAWRARLEDLDDVFTIMRLVKTRMIEQIVE